MEDVKKLDYSKLGLKCGLEIHQQLDSKKLFCECPSILRNDEPDFLITRNLHAIAGEEGSVDIAADFEAGLEREFVYQGYSENTCLVELDEEPPHEINKDALKIAIQIALLLNCKIVPLTQIMRKTVIDGSNTSGFQRSILIAQDGYIETKNRKVGINYFYLEEDSARIVEKTEDQVTFRLDRLGIPLVEIVTAPDIKTPEECKEVALKIGDILRSCKVKRGIGTIRQDINISIKGHPRAEIKGFQDPKIFVDVVKKEIERQKKNLQTNKKNLVFEVRWANPDSTTKFLRPMPGKARMYPETDLPLLKISRDLINEAKKELPKLKSVIEEELKDKGLNHEMIKLLLSKNKLDEFKDLIDILDDPNLVAKILLIFPAEIASHENISPERIEKFLNKDVLSFILELLRDKKISENQIKQIMMRVAKGTLVKDAVLFRKEDFNAIEEAIMKIIKEKPGLSENAYMGMVMKDFKGKISGSEAMNLIKKYVRN